MTSIEEIKAHEAELLQAMLTSNVAVLEKLLSDELIFTAHTGQVFRKKDDLEAHASGMIHIDSIEASEQIIRLYGNMAVVFVSLKIKGSFFGNYSEGTFRFSRIWLKEAQGCKIVAGQSTVIAAVC